MQIYLEEARLQPTPSVQIRRHMFLALLPRDVYTTAQKASFSFVLHCGVQLQMPTAYATLVYTSLHIAADCSLSAHA